MLDLAGTALTGEERDMLRHPLTGGVILFSRNYESPAQLIALTAEIHALRDPHVLIAVDHEGGRVQRFREGFTVLPPAARFGEIHDNDPDRARELARIGGWLLAAELRAAGVDFSFTPVLDLGRNVSVVIGDRALHRSPDVIAELAHAMMNGLHQAGMEAVGKHFPGHGSIAADSHETVPIDGRAFADIEMEDMVPFERMIRYGLAAIMPAHVIYPAVDDRPAGFSPVWLREILRRQMGFEGVIFSDDLSMAGAVVAGDYTERAHAALAAGCDMLVVCNDAGGAVQILDNLGDWNEPASAMRLTRMHGRPAPGRAALRADEKWQKAAAAISALEAEPELDLGDDLTA